MNHTQEAADMLDGTNPHGSPQEALAHATLALVEQQRIANLIAVATWNDAALNSGTFRRDGQRVPHLQSERSRVDALFQQIRQALGLA